MRRFPSCTLLPAGCGEEEAMGDSCGKLGFTCCWPHINPTLSHRVLLGVFYWSRGHNIKIALLWWLVTSPSPTANPPQPLFPITVPSPISPVGEMSEKVKECSDQAGPDMEGIQSLFAHGIVGILQDIQQQQKPYLFGRLPANLIIKFRWLKPLT